MSVMAPGALALTEVRAAAELALAPVADTDPDIYPDWADAVSPPALMLGWWDPWVETRSVMGGVGLLEAILQVQLVASRVDPGAGLEELEALLVYVVSRLSQDTHTWVLTAATTPRQWESGGIPLLGADLAFRVQIRI